MNKDAIVEKLRALRIATNVLLEKLTKERMAEKPFRRGGVNWADLKCCDAEFVIDLDGEEHYRVTVDEVSPDEYELASYVQQGLLKEFGYIEVLTEW